MKDLEIQELRSFWEANPLSAGRIPYRLGTPEYFSFYDRLREKNETPEFSALLHEYHHYSHKKVLDVGSGNGYVLGKYAQFGAQVYGVDLTLTGVELCQRRFEYQGLRGHFCMGNAEELPFPGSVFDCVCSMGVLHHTPNIERAMGEVFRVLKPGGRLILMVYHRNSALYQFKFRWMNRVTGKSRRQLVNEIDGLGNPKGEVFSKSEIKNLLRSFTDIETSVGLLQSWMILPRGARFVPDQILKRFERCFGWFLYAKAIKP